MLTIPFEWSRIVSLSVESSCGQSILETLFKKYNKIARKAKAQPSLFHKY